MSAAPAPALTAGSPLPRRLAAWMRERFPAGHAVLFLVLYLAALFYGRFLTAEGPLRLGVRDLLGFAAVYAFFLLLRILDEHKDYEADARNHPGRVLQRGIVTLRELRALGAAAVAVQLAASVWIDRGVGPVTLSWLAVLLWTGLMAKEFFVAAWLRARLLPYALSHMLVMPLAILWMARMGAEGARLPAEAAWLALLSFLSGLAFEVGRKTKAPVEERPGVDSYTGVLGVRGTALLLAVVLVSVMMVLARLLSLVLDALPLSLATLLMLALLGGCTVVGRFALHPTPRRARAADAAVSLSMMIAYLAFVAAMLSAGAVRWG